MQIMVWYAFFAMHAGVRLCKAYVEHPLDYVMCCGELYIVELQTELVHSEGIKEGRYWTPDPVTPRDTGQSA